MKKYHHYFLYISLILAMVMLSYPIEIFARPVQNLNTISTEVVKDKFKVVPRQVNTEENQMTAAEVEQLVECSNNNAKRFYGIPMEGALLPVYSNRLSFHACKDEQVTRAIIIVHGLSRTAESYFNYVSATVPQPPADSSSNETGNEPPRPTDQTNPYPPPTSNSVEVTTGNSASSNNQNSQIVQAQKLNDENSKFSIFSWKELHDMHTNTSVNGEPMPHDTEPVLEPANQGNTLLIAPLFAIKSSSICDPPVCPESDEYNSQFIYWSGHAWSRLNNAAINSPARVTSGQAIDIMMELLSNTDLYPNLKKVTIVGHSAGGQFVTRYSLSDNNNDSIFMYGDVKIRYVVVNPSSYLYLSPERYDSSTQEFKLPSEFTEPVSCAHYNEYRYGLDDLSFYVQDIFTHIEDHAKSRDIHLLLGEDDNYNEGHLDTDCAAYLQGAHRLERGQRYHEYLTWFFRDHPYGSHHTQIQLVPGVGHSTSGMFQSIYGRNIILW